MSIIARGSDADTDTRPFPAQDGDTPAVRLANVSRTFVGKKSTFTAITGVDLEVKRGEFLSVVGPSGCGKST